MIVYILEFYFILPENLPNTVEEYFFYIGVDRIGWREP